ncbi:hypothetical protein [Acinetobacter oleivorans]|uniref:hypothetical protein n=1 Tax=Acinetobacter oleivorans TaxID=1148157 RepID=UPI00157FBDBE|nr:hypothetical protein [Acinetobacter oleivorans]NUF12170.1 hypothetical protein [Acinetobacter oleivorans]
MKQYFSVSEDEYLSFQVDPLNFRVEDNKLFYEPETEYDYSEVVSEAQTKEDLSIQCPDDEITYIIEAELQPGQKYFTPVATYKKSELISDEL